MNRREVLSYRDGGRLVIQTAMSTGEWISAGAAVGRWP